MIVGFWWCKAIAANMAGSPKASAVVWRRYREMDVRVLLCEAMWSDLRLYWGMHHEIVVWRYLLALDTLAMFDSRCSKGKITWLFTERKTWKATTVLATLLHNLQVMSSSGSAGPTQPSEQFAGEPFWQLWGMDGMGLWAFEVPRWELIPYLVLELDSQRNPTFLVCSKCVSRAESQDENRKMKWDRKKAACQLTVVVNLLIFRIFTWPISNWFYQSYLW